MSARALARGAACVLLAAALAGCSATRMVYDNAQTLLRWRATSYLDLHDAQLRVLESRIERFLGWHRAHALPRYAALADEAGARLARGLSRADLDWGYDSLRAQVREALGAGGGEIAPLLDGLSAAQAEHLEQRIAEDNRRYSEEHVDGSPEERREHRMRRSIERLEDWFGSLSDGQRERVRQFSRRAPLLAGHRLRERERLQAELMVMVRARAAGARLAGRLREWDAGRGPEYLRDARSHREELFAMMLDLERTLSAAQRARAVERLQAYARDFRALAQAALPAGTTQ